MTKYHDSKIPIGNGFVTYKNVRSKPPLKEKEDNMKEVILLNKLIIILVHLYMILVYSITIIVNCFFGDHSPNVNTST